MSRIFSSGEPGPQLTWTAMMRCQGILTFVRMSYAVGISGNILVRRAAQ